MNDFFDDDAPFWGEDTSPTGQLRRIGKDATGQVRRVVHDHNNRHHFDRTREHRVVKAGPSRTAPAVNIQAFDYDLEDEYGTLGVADHADDAKWGDVDVWVDMDDDADRRPSAGWVGVDRRLLRVGALAAAAVVLIPVTIAMASGDQGSNGDVATQTPAPVVQPQTEPDPTVPVTIPVTAAIVPVTAAATENTSDDDLADNASFAGGVVDKGATEAASVAAAPVCAAEYTVVAGDYWLRLGDGTGASTDEWLAANGASLETALFPGDELCIPEGAAAPAPPTTTVPPTTAAPETTAAPTTAAPETTAAPAAAVAETTAAPTTAAPTTAPPATTAPQVSLPAPVAVPAPTPPAAVPGDVKSIIRSVFPASEAEYAITIATRESNLDPTAWNGHCCYGLFQIYYRVHASWLDDLGINSAQDLLDPYKNTLAAYTLWQRTGWGPWSTHYG